MAGIDVPVDLFVMAIGLGLVMRGTSSRALAAVLLCPAAPFPLSCQSRSHFTVDRQLLSNSVGLAFESVLLVRQQAASEARMRAGRSIPLAPAGLT